LEYPTDALEYPAAILVHRIVLDLADPAGKGVLALRSEGITWREEEGYRTDRGNARWSMYQVQQIARTVQLDREAAA